MPVYIFQGGLGAGKTLGMTVMGYGLKEVSGLPAYSNYGVHFAEPLRSLKQLYDLEDGIVLLDEFQVQIDSRNFAAAKVMAFTQFSLQSRKAGLIILGTTQRIHQIDKRVRGIVDLLIDCKKLGQPAGWRTRMGFYKPDGDETWRKYGTRTFMHESWMYDLYDTKRRVMALE